MLVTRLLRLLCSVRSTPARGLEHAPHAAAAHRYRAPCASAALALSLVACAGGQSGNEGDLPPAPCGSGGTVITAEVSALSASCVTLEVTGVAHAAAVLDRDGRALLGEDELTGGATLRGRRGTMYAYRHEFRVGDPVLVLVGEWDASLNFELMPLSGERVQIQWAGRAYEAPIAELASRECDVRTWTDLGRLPSGRSDGETPTAPPPEAEACTP